MSVWYCIPSARPAEEANRTLSVWRDCGYKIALFRDCGAEPYPLADVVMIGPYPGYAVAVNSLAKLVLAMDSTCDWIVTGGDDVLPDPRKAPADIADECSAHFLDFVGCPSFGVMQPIGDRWAGGHIDRICGSPWLGREFCLRINGGQGPLWPAYKHMFVDEELQCIASKLGIFKQRPDLTHRHNHWTRVEGSDTWNWAQPMPEFLRDANHPLRWLQANQLFDSRKREGFPGHEPLAVPINLPVEIRAL